MDAGAHPQPSPENPTDSIPPRQAGDNDTVERPCSGPLKSPQKRLMQEMHHAEDTTPRRRSVRLAQTSTPVRPLNLRITVPQVEGTVGEADPGNDTAEINQDVEDGKHQSLVFFQGDLIPLLEPSQVLAERVLSAVSNPSPPPDFLSFPDVHVNTPPPPELPEYQTQSDNTSAATTPPNLVAGSPLNDGSVENAPADPVNPASPPHTPGFSPKPSGSSRQYALTAEKPLVTESSAGDTSDPPPLTSAATSSVNPLIRLQTDRGEHPVTMSEKGKGREIVDDETRDQVAELPILSEPPIRPAGRRRSARRSASPAKQRSTSPDGNLLQPPRRSARLSASPSRTPSPDPTLVLPQISPLRLPTKNARTRSDPSEIGALSTVGGIDEKLREVEVEEIQERAGRKRKRQDDANNAVGRQRLGSLSPDSQSVLQQLLPSSRSSSDEDERAKATTSQQSLFGPQRILMNKPPRLAQSTHIQSTDPQPRLGTPLRRVLVSTSVVLEDGGPNGRRSGQTLSKMQSLDDPNRSPSRRVLVATHPSSTVKPVALQPAVSSRQPSTSGSVSTLPIHSKPIAKQRSMSEEPTFSRKPSSEINHRTALPYPLTQKPSIIPEELEETRPPNSRASSEPPVTPLTSIPRSTLRQPTNPSRIPRIGAKPYSRPVGVQPSKLPIPASAKRTVPSPVCLSTLKSVFSDFSNFQTKPRNLTGSTLALDPKHQPSIPTSSRKTAGPNAETSKAPAKRPLPTKRPHQRQTGADKPPPSQIPVRSPPPPQSLALPDLQPSIAAITQTEPTKPEQEQTNISERPTVPPEDQLASENVPISTRLRPRDTIKEEEDASTARRMTRSRRGPSALLEQVTFGTTNASPSRPPPKKRPPPDSSGFAGLSITALKNLTADNTTKNQKVVSLLETEIVKREGKRPDSPVVKLRTIAEKANEEKAKKREERAQRRAKRSDDGEFEPLDANGLPLEDDSRHRRGAGEEEDYESPERPMRPLKRLKADGSEEVEAAMVKERRVQWDRLLFTAVFIDEIPEKPPRPPDQKLEKGCLSQTAKVYWPIALTEYVD